ncbi:hypothetical protein DRQ09_03340 [candidate division KSB1 bacterium]|nr:MAG: hypothetical protein DRQ09_03340 [candidate division KSB1 bacterium]
MNKLNFQAGEFIYHEGDIGREMYIITSGKVESIREMGDDQIVLEILGAKSFFGEMALFGDPVRTTSIKAIEDTEVVVVNKKTLESQFRKVPEWLVTIIKTIAQRIIKTKKGIKPKTRISLDYSIIKTIGLLVEEYGLTEERGKSVNLRLVRDEVCNLLGITEDVLDSRLQKLNQFNLVSVKGSSDRLYIPDKDRLEKYAKFLIMKSPEGSKFGKLLNPNEIQAYERIYKVIKE